MIFSYGFTYGIGMIASWEVSSIVLLMLSALYAGMLFVRKYAKKKKFPVELFLALMGLVFLGWEIYRSYQNGIEASYLGQIIDYYSGWNFRGPLDMRYGWLLLSLLLLAGACFYYICEKNFWAKFGIAVGCFGIVLWQAIEEVPWEPLPIAALLFLGLEGAVLYIRQKVQKRVQIGRRELFPLLVGAVVIAAVFPVSERPFPWEKVENLWHKAENALNELASNLAYGGEGNEFFVGVTGFTEDHENFWGRLVNRDIRELMEVSAYTSWGTQSKYFAGVIKDTFEDDNWMGDGEAEQEYRNGEIESEQQWMLWEHLYYLYQSGLKGSEDEYFCQNYTYSFRYESLHTGVLFYPANTYRIFPGGRDIRIDIVGSNLKFAQKQSSGDVYQISALAMNLEQENLVEYLRKATMRSLSGESLEEIPAQKSELEALEKGEEGDTLFDECVRRMNIKDEEIAGIMSDSWASARMNREREIRRKDLQLPDTISADMKHLAAELTDGIDNDYDKVQAILHYLKREGGFSYSREPKEAPEGSSVMDTFLFESREGYCTYFATALTLLCRLSEIPARYVEGFSVKYEQGENGWYPIWGSDAHAWTQVYLTGFGWMDVDASPGYQTGGGNWRNMAASYAQEGDRDHPKGTEAPEQASESEENGESLNRLQIGAREIFGWIGVGFACFILMFLMGRTVMAWRFRRAGRRKQVEILMRRLLGSLKGRIEGIASDETLRMYRKRLGENGVCGDETLLAFEWYEGVRYGKRPIEMEDIRRLENICEIERKQTRKYRRMRLLKKIKGRTGKIG